MDDGSKDNTLATLKTLQADYPRLEVQTKANGGHGAAVLFGYRYALAAHADWVFQTDSDGQTSPAEFMQFWDMRRNYDAVFGNRSQRGDGQQRAAVEQVVCALVRLFFGAKVPDANAPFRLMSRNLLERVLPLMPENYNLPNIIITASCNILGFSSTFRQVSFAPRQGGVNSINMKRIVGIGMQALRDFPRIAKTVKDAA